MNKKDLITAAVAFIQAQNSEDYDERWETPQATAEDIICQFLESMSIPTWKVSFTWKDGRTQTHSFVLESIADFYLADQLRYYAMAPCGSPTSHKKEFKK